MICRACGTEAPTRRVVFCQNVGAVLIRFTKTIDARLCKACIHRYFWRFTLVDLFFGWWGIASLFVTPCFLLNNVVRYLASLGLESPPAPACRPQLTREAVERIRPYTRQLIDRLNRAGDLDDVIREVAAGAAVSPGQVLLYLSAETSLTDVAG